MVLSFTGGAVGHAPGELALVRGHLYVWRRFARRSGVMSRRPLMNVPKLGQSRKRINRHVANSTRVINIGRCKTGVVPRCHMDGQSGSEARRPVHESAKGVCLGEHRSPGGKVGGGAKQGSATQCEAASG